MFVPLGSGSTQRGRLTWQYAGTGAPRQARWSRVLCVPVRLLGSGPVTSPLTPDPSQGQVGPSAAEPPSETQRAPFPPGRRARPRGPLGYLVPCALHPGTGTREWAGPPQTPPASRCPGPAILGLPGRPGMLLLPVAQSEASESPLSLSSLSLALSPFPTPEFFFLLMQKNKFSKKSS